MSGVNDFIVALVAMVTGLWWLWAFIALVAIACLAVSGGIAVLDMADRALSRRRLRSRRARLEVRRG